MTDPAPEDIIPPNNTPLQPGTTVDVVFPGRIIEDVDGTPIGMEANVTYHSMRVADDGSVVGFPREDENR